MKRVVISEFMDEAAVAQLAARFDVLHVPDLVDQPEKLRRELHRAHALVVRNRTRVEAGLLDAAPVLQVVGRLGVGLDNIDLAACRARGIEVIPATGANAHAVAEYVIVTAMMLLRGLHACTDEVAAGSWPRARIGNGRELAGKTLGLIGFGDIGRRVARLARGFGVHALAHDPQLSDHDPLWTEEGVRPAALSTILERSDVVSLHVPLTAATRHLIDAPRLAQMKRGAVLIDTARGGVVDEAALAAALRSGTLGGAALDVFAQEPLPAGSPFVGCPNLVLTPHIAGVTLESNQRVSMLIAEKVAAALATRDSESHAAP